MRSGCYLFGLPIPYLKLENLCLILELISEVSRILLIYMSETRKEIVLRK